jgi:hypothetical protein
MRPLQAAAGCARVPLQGPSMAWTSHYITRASDRQIHMPRLPGRIKIHIPRLPGRISLRSRGLRQPSLHSRSLG